MDRCIHQRAIVAGALGQSVVVAHQAPIAAIAAIPRSAVLLGGCWDSDQALDLID